MGVFYNRQFFTVAISRYNGVAAEVLVFLVLIYDLKLLACKSDSQRGDAVFVKLIGQKLRIEEQITC